MSSFELPRPQGSGVVFVTGAGGFMGGAVAAAFQQGGWRVAGFGHPRRQPQDAEDLTAPEIWLPGDIIQARLVEGLKALGPPEIVFHAAGGASVGASLADPAADFARTIGTLRETLAFLQAEAPMARLIYPSSAAVYGSARTGPIGEDAPLEPISPYGRHRVAAEAQMAKAAKTFGLDGVAIRFFSVYGPRLRKQLLWELAGRLAKAPETVELAGTGEEARDFLHIDDAVRMIGLAAGLEPSDRALVLNGAMGRAVTVRQIAEGLAGAMGATTRISFTGAVREGDPPSLVGDPQRAAEELGFTAATTIEEGLKDLAAWLGPVHAALPV